jgi:hypothetical protein
MNETIKAHVDQVLDDIRGIYLQAAERIEALRPGEKLPATALAEDLAKDLGLTGPQLYPIVKRLLEGYPGTTWLGGPLPRFENRRVAQHRSKSIGGPAALATSGRLWKTVQRVGGGLTGRFPEPSGGTGETPDPTWSLRRALCAREVQSRVGRPRRRAGRYPGRPRTRMKATTTRTLNPLPFQDLKPHRFEDLVRQLAYDLRRWKALLACLG